MPHHLKRVVDTLINLAENVDGFHHRHAAAIVYKGNILNTFYNRKYCSLRRYYEKGE